MGTSRNSDYRIQPSSEGTGPLYHRIYRIALSASWERTLAAMQELQECPNDCSPQWIATFEKTKGDSQQMKVGDEFEVHLPTSWDAPVRVTDLSPTHFRFETLEGHPESGAIEFRVRELTEHETLFEIESFARSHGALMDLIYDKIPVARFVQKVMWEKFCLEFAAHVKGKGTPLEPLEKVEVITEKKEDAGQWKSI